MFKQDIKLQFLLLASLSTLSRTLEEVHGFDDARVVEHPLHFKFLEHIREFFNSKTFIVEDLTLLYYTCHWLQYVWCINLSQIHVALPALSDLPLVADEEL